MLLDITNARLPGFVTVAPYCFCRAAKLPRPSAHQLTSQPSIIRMRRATVARRMRIFCICLAETAGKGGRADFDAFRAMRFSLLRGPLPKLNV